MIRTARTIAGLLWLALFLLFVRPSAGITADQNILIDHYRSALQVDPDNLALHYYLGVSLLIDGHNKEAVDSFTRAYPALADSVEMNYNFGLAWSRLGDPDSALLYLEQAEHLGANVQPGLYPFGEAYYNIALTYLQRGDVEEALALFARVLQLNPDLTDVYRIRGDYYARNGDTSRAITEFQRYQAIYPEDPAVREYLFSLFINQGLQQLESAQNEAAIQSFREAAKCGATDSPIPHYYLGFIAYQLGRYNDAVRELGSAYPAASPELQESIRAILYNSALALQQQGNSEQAWQAIAPIASRQEAFPRELLLAGNICLSLKRFDTAIDFYRRVLVLEPTQRSAALNLLAAENALLDATFTQGQENFAAKRYDLALPLFEKVLKGNPAYPLASQYANECHTEMRRQAKTAFDMAAQTLAKGDARLALEQVRSGLALAATDEGGLRLQGQALASLSRDLESRLLLAEGLLAAGQLKEAHSTYRAILQLDPANATAIRELARVNELERAAIDAELARARQALDEGDPLAAQEIYRRLRDIEPTDQRFQDGVARATHVARERSTAELRLSREARAAGRKDESRKHLETALRFQDSPEIRHELGQVQTENLRQSSTLLAAARETLEQNDLKRTRSLLDKLRSTAPDTQGLDVIEREYQTVANRMVTGLLDKANAQLEAKNYGQALAGFRRALDLDPLNGSALRGLQQGKLVLQQELARLVLWGNESLARGDFVRAESAFGEALALDPMLAAAKSGMEQLAHLQQTEAKPGDDERIYLRGIEYYTRGKYEEAVVLWNQVLRLNPQHEKARMNIEKARRKMQQIKEYRRG